MNGLERYDFQSLALRLIASGFGDAAACLDEPFCAEERHDVLAQPSPQVQFVIPGLDPGIHVDGRIKSGHDVKAHMDRRPNKKPPGLHRTAFLKT